MIKTDGLSARSQLVQPEAGKIIGFLPDLQNYYQ